MTNAEVLAGLMKFILLHPHLADQECHITMTTMTWPKGKRLGGEEYRFGIADHITATKDAIGITAKEN